MHERLWRVAGVVTPEELDPDPFLERLAREGMPWHVRDDTVRAETPSRRFRSSREIVAA